MLDEFNERIAPEVAKLAALMDYGIDYLPVAKHPKECEHENVTFVMDMFEAVGEKSEYKVEGLYCNDCETYIEEKYL